MLGKKLKFADVPGLCKAATIKEIEAQGWSLNPGRYVGVAPGEEVDSSLMAIVPARAWRPYLN